MTKNGRGEAILKLEFSGGSMSLSEGFEVVQET
jgi:hypothetical protein